MREASVLLNGGGSTQPPLCRGPFAAGTRRQPARTSCATCRSCVMAEGSTSISSSSSSSSSSPNTNSTEGPVQTPPPPPAGGACPACGRAELESGCNGEGRIQGGIGAIPGFEWWPIKAFRPCPAFLQAGGRYRRSGQSLNELAFGRKGSGDDLDVSQRLKR